MITLFDWNVESQKKLESEIFERIIYQNTSKLKRYMKNGQKRPATGERMNNYAMTGLYKLFFDLAGEVYKNNIMVLKLSDRLEHVYKVFNKNLVAYCKKSFYCYVENDSKNIYRIDDTLFENLFMSKTEVSEGSRLVRKFTEARKNLTSVKCDCEQPYFRYSDAITYLDAYLDLCRFIFKPNCIKEEELRSQKIIEKMLNIEYNTSENCFGLYSPFVVFGILRVISYIVALPDQISQSELSYECAEILNRRKHIIATYAIRSFSRFTTINSESFVVEYSRRNDKIICKEVNKVSSIDNVKPIRLFEKISSYIYDYFKENPYKKICDFNVSVYGFCACEIDDEITSVEIDDLIYEIFSWFEDKRKNDLILKDKSINNLRLNYYLIDDKADAECFKTCFYEYTEDAIDGKYNVVRKAELNISFNKCEKYNNNHIAKVLSESNLVFILDCPWLATEDFTIANEGDLQSYSQWVDKASYLNDIRPKTDALLCDNPLFDRVNLFASINDQFNRLAVNSVAKHGKIVRVMKDYMLNWIQEQIKEYRDLGIYKTVYIYNSSLRGMSYSNYANYPIIREESYSNKRFSIMRFSTRENHCVSLKDAPIQNSIYISLWNLVKYVDISFVFIGLKDFFEKYLFTAIKGFDTEIEQKAVIKRDIVSIMRNIVFVIDYVQNDKGEISDIRITIKLSEPVRSAFSSCGDPVFIQNVEKLITFFKIIIVEVIFRNSSGLGDNCIREAFERCLYNQAKTVNDIFFLHMYSKKKIEGGLSDFNVRFITDELKNIDTTVENLVPNFDSFSDKRAYKKLFEYFDTPMCPEFAIISTLNQVDKTFRTEDENQLHSKEILRLIRKVCEEFNYTESFLYKNLERF